MRKISIVRSYSSAGSLNLSKFSKESKGLKRSSSDMFDKISTNPLFKQFATHQRALPSILSISNYITKQSRPTPTPISQTIRSQSHPSPFIRIVFIYDDYFLKFNLIRDLMNIQRSKKLAGVTDSLNKTLGKSLESFAANTQWTDIHNWLTNVEVLLTDFPSPYIADKILLSKRLNQCMNPILPEKVHETVLNIHQRLFKNMRGSVDGNINDYIKLFAEDLGVYSVSILPHLVHTNNPEQRFFILKIINNYYLDLGKELIPMLGGLLKSLFSVYSATINAHLAQFIEFILHRVLASVGRRYVIGVTWSLILKYKDCKEGGIKFLSKVIDKMEYIRGEEEFEDSRGFSDIQRELQELEELEKNPLNPSNLPLPDRKSREKIIAHLENQHNEKPFDLSNQSPIASLQTPDKIMPNSVILEFEEPDRVPDRVPNNSMEGESLDRILEQRYEESVNESKSKIENFPERNDEIPMQQMEENQSRKIGRLFESQAPFRKSLLLQEESDIKLNTVPLMISQGICQIKEGIDTNSVENNFPNLNTLVVNSLISCLEEDQPSIKRAVLDFMFTHLRIKSQLLTEDDRKVLVEALLRLYKKKEISITKRVNRWIFGKEDEENRYTINEKNEFVIPYLIHAFKQILQTIPTQEDNCTLPLKILQNFYIEHPHLVEVTLKQIAMYVLRYIFNFGSKSEGWMKASDFYEEVLKIGKRFLQNLPSYYTIIFQSLGQAFIQGIRENKQEKAFQAVKYIDFCYINLMKHEHSLEQLQYITIILQYICTGLSEISSKIQSEKENQKLYKIYLKDAVLLIYNLIDRRKSVKKINKREQENINMKYYEETGDCHLPPERIKYQEELREREIKEEIKYVNINAKLEMFFVRLGYVVRNFTNIQEFQESFKLCSMAIVRLQLHLPAKDCQSLPKWFNTLEGAIKVSNPLVSLSAIEAMIKCLMWENKHPIYNSFKLIIMQEKVNKVGTDYQKLALEKLWSLLDYPHMHSKIIDLIVGFSKYFPFEFTETVKRSFNTHSAPDKEASIQRFSHFWRLTGYKYKDLLNIHKEFVELNKVGLFRMLDFLDDQNPLVRHAAKSWLMQSMTLLTRVIEPLLQQLISGCQEWYETPKGIYLIQNVYDTNNIFSTFRRIRSILANGSYTFLRFVYQAQISQTLNEQREKITQISSKLLTTEDRVDDNLRETNLQSQREPVLPKALENLQKSEVRGNRMSYLDLLIILTVKYIEGHAIESMGVEFYIGNSGVNTSAVQLIETLLDYIDNPILCEKLINYIIDYLFKVLSQAVLNKEYIMQIQLMNLIKNIFFNSSFRKKADLAKVREFFKNVFTNKLFLVSILDGLHTPFAYVRSQFISFITVCIPLIADFLDPLECTECIRHILYTYYKIIKDIGGTLAKAVVEDSDDDSEQYIKMGKNLSMSKIFQLQVKIKMQQKFVKFSDNLKQVGKTNEILSVLHGVESILNYFYDLNKLDVKELNFEFTNPYTLFDTFKKIVTLGLANSEKNAKLVERKNFLHNFETCEALLKDLEPVYETILRSWPLSEEFVRIGSEEFSSVGMRSFNFQRFNKYNKVVKELIGYVQEERESIWGKIYCIMQPMFCKFPKEIIDIYLKLWIRECSSVKNETGKVTPEPQKTELLMKIMQTIIVNNFPMNIVIHAFLESTAIEELNHYYSTKGNDKKGTVLDYTIDKSQSKLLYFVYVYFNYVYLNEKELTYEPLLEIWSLIIKALKPFEKSRTPLSAIWIIEIINLCAKKYSPKELLKNQRFKTDLHALINEKLKYIASIASRKEILFFGQPLTKLKFDDEEKIDQYHVVLPLPPTIYDILKTKKDERNHSDSLALREFRPGENSELESRYRVYCFKILKRLGLQILQNTYLPEKTHWVVIRTCQWIDLILPVIEDKSLSNMVFAECASQVLYDLLDRARILFIKDLKAKVLQIFNKDDFFICNINTLNYWSKIIDWIVSMDKNNETYFEYLNKVTLSSSYFTSESVDNKRRIKSFERICFILYSGQKDKYGSKLKYLLEKIADVIKKPENAHAALLILVLFAIRILILRLSEITLNQLFIDIWPMILTLLMQTFSKQLVRVHIHNEISKNPNYLLAALKLIEMISLTNLGEFAHHQWIFVCDYFGVQITVPEVSSEMTEHFSKRPELAKIISTDNRNQTTPFIYRPYLLNYIPQSSLNYIPENKKEEKIDYKPQKRLIIVKDSFLRDQGELKLNTMLLMQYMIYLSEFRTYVDWKEVEEVIVNDFINLDSFIHQIS